nr:MAG TPA: hypothetical protein [Crassvirales sp.]
MKTIINIIRLSSRIKIVILSLQLFLIQVKDLVNIHLLMKNQSGVLMQKILATDIIHG